MPKYRDDELDTIERAYHTGRELADAGLLEDAIGYFDVVLGRLPRKRRDRTYRIDPTRRRVKQDGVLWLPPVFRDALLAKAYCLNELGHFDDAFRLLERAAELDPENPQVYAELGFAHGSQDHLEQARLAYTQAATLEPENAAHLRALAHLGLLQEHYPEVAALAHRALQLEPGHIISLHQLAYAEYRMDNLPGALEALRQAVIIAPQDRESVLRLAGTLREASFWHEAIAVIDAYLRLTTDDLEAEVLLTELLQHEPVEEILRVHVARLQARDPRDVFALDLLAWNAYHQGRFAESLAQMRQVVALMPDDAAHHFKLALLAQALGLIPLAMTAFQRALLLDREGQVARMATDAITGLDQAQLEQVLVRATKDPIFRASLETAPEKTLVQRGYLLSPVGFEMLHSLETHEHLSASLDGRVHQVH